MGDPRSIRGEGSTRTESAPQGGVQSRCAVPFSLGRDDERSAGGGDVEVRVGLHAGMTECTPRRQMARLQWILRAWSGWVRKGGYGAPLIDDDDEAIFGSRDPTPKERSQNRQRLREYLREGQEEWRKDGGVKVRKVERDEAAKGIMAFVRKAEKRRPKTVIPLDGDAREHLGQTWNPDDFEGVDADLRKELERTWQLEQEQLASMHRTGYHRGFTINADGCRMLGLSEEKIEELMMGADFRVSPDLPHYSKGAYPMVYANKELLMLAAQEFNKWLRWLVPVNAVPWIESRVLIVSKPSLTEADGWKHRPVIDKTDSGLNAHVEDRTFSLPQVDTVIQNMGLFSEMIKLDLESMFYSFRVHPRRWTVMGVRHPLTHQAYVLPVLPMGFKLSPPIACANSQLMADIINDEMLRRWEGRPGHPALACVPRTSRRPPAGIQPHASVYVDDYMLSAVREWLAEMVRVSEVVFRLVGVTEKESKRVGPGYVLELLGFEFDSTTGILTIPAHKAQEIRALLASILQRARRGQSVSWAELAALHGKLLWSTPAVVCGKFYLRNIRKVLIAAQMDLCRRADRESFCIPLSHFGRALDELEWWEAAYGSDRPMSRAWYVGFDGKFCAWRWEGDYAQAHEVPSDVGQFTTDACLDGGGYEYEEQRVIRDWDEAERREHINVLETLTVLQCVEEMAPRYRGRRLLGWCDNVTAVQAINLCRSKSDRVLRLARRVHLICAQFDLHLWMHHIPGILNQVADQLSRRMLSARATLWSLLPECMARWRKRAGGAFDWDAFSDPSGDDSMAPRYRSAVSDPREFQPRGSRVWAFPPLSLVEPFLAEAPTWQATVVVAVVPRDRVPDGPWELWHIYGPQARVFSRPSGGRRVRSQGGGVEWAVIALFSEAGARGSRMEGGDNGR